MSKTYKQSLNYTFLFGAGADFQFGLPCGKEFSKSLLTNRFSDERKKLLGDEYALQKLIYYNSRTVFLQTIFEHKDEAEKYIEKEIIEICCNYFENGEGKDEVVDICKSWVNKLTGDHLVTNYMANDKEIDFFLENATFFTTLDGKFNELRHPQATVRGKRVINAYYIVFILMLEHLFDIENLDWSLKSVWRLLRTEKLRIDFNINSYYRTLAQCKLKFNVVTTNYTPIVEQIVKKPITYLHGNLCWFEKLDNLAVYNCKDDDDFELLCNSPDCVVPFILIPSGVKPLICNKQIEQFYDFIKYLDNSNVLCIVGYKFNSEDNHINSIIAKWLRLPRHKIIYLNYKGEMNWQRQIWARKFYNSKPIYANSNIDFNNILSMDTQIVDIITNEDNSQNTFDSIVKILEDLSYN